MWNMFNLGRREISFIAIVKTLLNFAAAFKKKISFFTTLIVDFVDDTQNIQLFDGHQLSNILPLHPSGAIPKGKYEYLLANWELGWRGYGPTSFCFITPWQCSACFVLDHRSSSTASRCKWVHQKTKEGGSISPINALQKPKAFSAWVISFIWGHKRVQQRHVYRIPRQGVKHNLIRKRFITQNVFQSRASLRLRPAG